MPHPNRSPTPANSNRSPCACKFASLDLRLQCAAKLAGTCAGPLSECTMKCAAFGETQLQGNVHDAAARMTQVADGEIPPQLILDRLIGLPFLMQSAAHGRGRHVQFIGQSLEIRDLARQVLTEPPPNPCGEAAAVLVF